jgi:hypothetical protein
MNSGRELSTTKLEEVDKTPWVVYEETKGHGNGKHIVLIAGDEEYRSEEALPMLGKILAKHHGFRCTVLFSINRQDSTIDPEEQTHIPGLHNIADADLLVLLLRFRELPDTDMKYIADHVDAGKPILGIRTSTHAFSYERNLNSPYEKYSVNSKVWPGGFGRQILGETWISHHGHHAHEATRGIPNKDVSDHPILRGVHDVFGPSDVYGISDLPDDATVLLWGQVLSGMEPNSAPIQDGKNEPMMPIAWTREIDSAGTEENMRVICSTIGAAIDLQSADLRRMLVNACYWCLRLENTITAKSKVDTVGKYEPSFFGFGAFKKGVKPAAHQKE